MKSISKPLVICFIGCLCLSSQIWAVPPSDAQEEQLVRDKDFVQKAIAGKLDCSKEISKREHEFSKGKSQVSNIYDAHYWRTFGTQQCFRALLKAKAFDTALQFVESSKQDYLDEWWELALGETLEVPVYATEGKCKSGEVRYKGDEQEKLITALLRGRDLSEHPPGRRGGMESVLVQMSIYEKYPACMEKKIVIGWLNNFIDMGLETRFWWEEPMVVGGLTTFSGVMRLGDVDLVRRILAGGLNQNRKFAVYLYARAPSVEMIQILERHFKLKKSEYKTVLKIIDAEKLFPESVREYGAGMAHPEVIEYFKQCAQ